MPGFLFYFSAKKITILNFQLDPNIVHIPDDYKTYFDVD